MPGAVLEAMAESLPVLATRVPGNASVVADGINGLLVPLDEPKALVQAAVQLCRDGALRKKFGDAGRKLVEEKHSVKKEVDRYEALYKKILSE